MAHKATLAELEREIRATELRRDGQTYHAIALELGYADHTGAMQAVSRCLARRAKEPTEEVRAHELERLDYMWRNAVRVLEAQHVTVQQGKVVTLDGAPLADDAPVLNAMDRLLKIQERRSRLLGLDAPSRQVIQIIPQDAIDAEIAQLEAQLAERADRSDTREPEKADGTSQTGSGEE
jgi:hypothetical protein